MSENNGSKTDLDFVAANFKPSYTHIQFNINREQSPTITFEEAFAYMFVGGVLPEVGDKIEMVCSQRDEDGMKINLKVVKNPSKAID